MDKKQLKDIPLSVLDLAIINEGHTPSDTFKNSLDLAKYVEQHGFKRFWLAEHHNMANVGSSATSVLIGHIAGGTSSIRVGSGGIMLPNHAPLIVAEQFGTLASLFPGRIDLGLGRAPGTDQLTAMALRRDRLGAGNDFYKNIAELRAYLDAENRTSAVRAIPGEGLDIPIWILGSSTDSAYLAAALGLPYSFASHFAPTYLHTALKLYRDNFRPSAQLQKPYVMPAVNVIAADTDEEAERIASSFYRMALGIITGSRYPLQPPVESMENLWTEFQEEAVKSMMAYSFIGNPETVQAGLQDFLDDTQADELMIVSHIYHHADRLRSYEILHEIQEGMKAESIKQ